MNQALIDGIKWGGWHWTTPGSATTTITYYFAPSGQFNSFDSTWTAVEKTAYKAAVQSWANVANLSFQEVGSASNATFIEHSVPGSVFNPPPGYVILGQHETPDTAAPAEGYFNFQGIGWDWNNSNGGLQVGGFGYLTLVHELGHGLGMAHPHDHGGGSPIWPGVTDAGSLGANNLNQDVNTVMSYNHGVTTKPVSFGANADNYGYWTYPVSVDS